MSDENTQAPMIGGTAFKNRIREKLGKTPIGGSSARLGAEQDLLDRARALKARALKNRFERKRLLVVPDGLKKKHPDKHFAFINYNKLVKNSGWHPSGYIPFKVDDKDKMDMDKRALHDPNMICDSYYHRGEMVLAYLPKEEYDERQLEDKILRDEFDLTDIVNKSKDLESCDAIMEEVTEVVVETPEAAKKRAEARNKVKHPLIDLTDV